MNLALAFWAPWDSPEPEADVRRQALEWAQAEPNVVACEILRVFQPDPQRRSWYQVDVQLVMRQKGEQMTWLAA